MIASNDHSGMTCDQAEHWMCLYLAKDPSVTKEREGSLEAHLQAAPSEHPAAPVAVVWSRSALPTAPTKLSSARCSMPSNYPRGTEAIRRIAGRVARETATMLWIATCSHASSGSAAGR